MPETFSTASVNGANRRLTVGQAARTPPHDLDAEEALLGAMLLSRDAASVGNEICSAADFYGPAHGHIFGAIQALMERGEGIDAVTVADLLKRSGVLEQVGDPSIFVSLQANTPSIANARHYAAIVADHALSRRLIERGQRIMDAGYSGDPSVGEEVARLALDDVVGARGAALPGRLIDGWSFIGSESDVVPVWGVGDEILWSSGEALLVVGPTGVGKTSLAQQLVLHRMGLRDGPLLGLPVTVDPECVVLYLAMDRPKQAARSMRRMVDDTQADELTRRLQFWPGPPERDLAKHPEDLLTLAQQTQARLVVVDSLKDAALGLSEDEVGAGWNRSVQGCLAGGVDLLILHHQRKSQQGSRSTGIDEAYGSTWITAGAGSVVLLSGSAGDPVVELTHLKQPCAPVGPLRVEHDHGSGTSTVVEGFDLLRALRSASAGISAPEAARLWFGTDRPTDNDRKRAKRALDQLVDKELAHRTDAREGGTGGTDAARYYAVTPREDQAS